MGVLEYATGGAQSTVTNTGMLWVGTAKFLGVPVLFIFFVITAIAAYVILSSTQFGYALRATGTNRAAASIAGVNTTRTITVAFIASSMGALMAGIALASYSSSAISSMSECYDFNALAAVVIGGTSLFGGRGSITGTVLGVLFISVLLSVLSLVGLPYQWQQFIQGVII